MLGTTAKVLAATVLLVGATTSLASAQPDASGSRPHARVQAEASAPASVTPLGLGGVQGSPDGLVWQVEGGSNGQSQSVLYESVFGGVQGADLGLLGAEPAHAEYPFSLIQKQLYLAGPTGNVGVDITTGQQLPTFVNCIRTGSGCFAINLVGTGSPASYTYTDDATGTTMTYGPVLLDGTSARTDTVVVRAIDAGGVVLEAWGPREPRPSTGADAATVVYLDFASGQYTVLDDTASAASGTVAMDADYIVWTHDEHAVYLNRSNLSALPAPATPDGAIVGLALNGDTLAYTTTSPGDDPDAPHTVTAHTGTLGGTTFVAATEPVSTSLTPIDAGDFAAVAGNTVADYGIYRLTPGASALGPAIALLGFARPSADDPPDDFTGDRSSAPAVIDTTKTWSIQGSATPPQQFGRPGDIPAVIDNVAGIAQIGVFRPANGTWYIKENGVTVKVQWGVRGDIPVAAHYSGTAGGSILAVFRPSTGKWYIHGTASFVYGKAGDVPVPGAYFGTDGSHHADSAAVFRPSTGTWWIRGHGSVRYGQKGDIPVPGDYDGNGTTDIAVYRPSTQQWYVRGHSAVRYGEPGDIAVLGDFTGDGHADIAVFRPSTGTWWIRGARKIVFGKAGDVPVESAP